MAMSEKTTRENLRCYILVPSISGGEEKFYIVGKSAADATLAFGTTVETKTTITQKTAINVSKRGTWSLPIATEINLDDPVIEALTKATEMQNINKEFNVLIVWQFRHKKGENTENMILAHNFKAVIPLTDLGGAGQSNIITNFTISSSSDIARGFVDITPITGRFDPATDTLALDAFIKDEDTESVGFSTKAVVTKAIVTKAIVTK